MVGLAARSAHFLRHFARNSNVARMTRWRARSAAALLLRHLWGPKPQRSGRQEPKTPEGGCQLPI